jgi:hypothetical protein
MGGIFAVLEERYPRTMEYAGADHKRLTANTIRCRFCRYLEECRENDKPKITSAIVLLVLLPLEMLKVDPPAGIDFD